MKRSVPFAIAAAAFVFTACDKEKVDEAKTKTVETAKSAGEAIKETTGKVLDKTGEVMNAASEKLKQTGAGLTKKDTPSEAAFKMHLTAYSAMMKKFHDQGGDNAAKLREMANQLMARLGTIPVDGLPAETAKAFRDYQNIMRRSLSMLTSIPEDAAGQSKWELDHGKEMRRLEEDSVKATKALKDAAAKHGLTGLDLGESKEEPKQ